MNATAPPPLSCPCCGVALTAEIVGSFDYRRCNACGGVWLEPETFRALCEADASGAARPRTWGAAPGAGTATTDAAGSPSRHVRYVRCPQCDDVMNRVNFARVSGVVIDVCRPHGAWFDAGELRAVRRFVRESGLRRFEFARRRALDHDRRPPGPSTAAPGGSSSIDPIDILAGIPDPWDVPSRRSPARGVLRAAVLAIAGGWLLWGAFTFDGVYTSRWNAAAGAAAMGCLLLLGAYRALDHAIARWMRVGRDPDSSR